MLFGFFFQSDEEETDDKKNTKIGEDTHEKTSVGSRRRSQETRQEDAKVSVATESRSRLPRREIVAMPLCLTVGVCRQCFVPAR